MHALHVRRDVLALPPRVAYVMGCAKVRMFETQSAGALTVPTASACGQDPLIQYHGAITMQAKTLKPTLSRTVWRKLT